MNSEFGFGNSDRIFNDKIKNPMTFAIGFCLSRISTYLIK